MDSAPQISSSWIHYTRGLGPLDMAPWFPGSLDPALGVEPSGAGPPGTPGCNSRWLGALDPPFGGGGGPLEPVLRVDSPGSSYCEVGTPGSAPLWG